MDIKKNTLLKVKHSRFGGFVGIALRDFNTVDTTFYPIALAEDITVHGMNTYWTKGEEVPCRDSQCRIEVLK